MGTIVTIEVPPHAASVVASAERDAALDRAFGWFRHIEGVCTRFDPAERADGAVARAGHANRHQRPAVRSRAVRAGDRRGNRRRVRPDGWRTHGGRADSIATTAPGTDHLGRDSARTAMSATATWSSTTRRTTVTLHRPLVLDLGGVAKGLAVDLAARELAPLQHFAIDAGGDLYLAGRNGVGAPWSVGIRHPTLDDELLDTLEVSDEAVCTSGLYERRPASGADAPHIIDPRAGEVAAAAISATVVASSAMLADAFATAAFVLGPADGLALLRAARRRGRASSTTALDRLTTRGMSSRDCVDIAVIA